MFFKLHLILASKLFGFHAKIRCIQSSHRLEKYLNLEGFLEKSLKIK